MATKCNPHDYRQHFVRLEIGVSAQFKADTKQEVTYENMRNYFLSSKFKGNENIERIISFLNEVEAMGCLLEGYSNPLSSHSIVNVEFELLVPKKSCAEFDAKYSRYSSFFY